MTDRSSSTTGTIGRSRRRGGACFDGITMLIYHIFQKKLTRLLYYKSKMM